MHKDSFFRKFWGGAVSMPIESKRCFLFVFLAICFSAKDFQVWKKIHFRVSLKCALTIPRFRLSFRLGLAWEIAMFRSFFNFWNFNSLFFPGCLETSWFFRSLKYFCLQSLRSRQYFSGICQNSSYSSKGFWPQLQSYITFTESV